MIPNLMCVTPEAARLENYQQGAGHLFRNILTKFDLISASSAMRPGDTYFGQRCSTLIDHVCIPIGLFDHVLGGGPLRTLGRRLMLPNTRFFLDHLPCHVNFKYLFAHFSQEEGPDNKRFDNNL